MERTEFELFMIFLSNIKEKADKTFAETGSFRAKLISEHAKIAHDHAVLFKSNMEIKKVQQAKILVN